VQQRDNVFGVKIITDKEPCLGDVDLEEGYNGRDVAGER
jgi:hypothetical protein